jgi:hypothetical protein
MVEVNMSVPYVTYSPKAIDNKQYLHCLANFRGEGAVHTDDTQGIRLHTCVLT